MSFKPAKLWILILSVATMLPFGSLLEFDENFHAVLGKSIYLPDENLLGDIPNGISFFQDIPTTCLRKMDHPTSVKHQSFYKNTREFYKSVATQTSLKASYEGSFSLGVSLDVTTKSVSGSKRSVSGTSLNVATKAYELHFKPNCLYETSLQSRVLSDFAELNTAINNPWYKVSWRKYQTFLKTHGSHVITSVTYGSSLNQYVFSEESSSYSQRMFTVKACADLGLGVPATAGKIGLSVCSGVTKEEMSRTTNLKMSSSNTIRGGTSQTRNKLLYDRSSDIIIKFLTEGFNNPTPIEFTLTPIWEILRRHDAMRRANKNTNVQTQNLQQYYDGYLNFGCPYITGIRGPPLQMFHYSSHSTAQHPVFECSIAPSGCHSNDDCRYQVPVKCICRGSSCIHHTQKKVSGANRLTATSYWGWHWDWNGCDWTLWGSRCGCKNENKKRKQIFP